MNIKENLDQIKSYVPEQVTLVAVSKTKPISDLWEAYNAGQRILGKIKSKKWLRNMKTCQKIFNGI